MKRAFLFLLMAWPMWAGALAGSIPTRVFDSMADYPDLMEFGSWIWIIFTSMAS